MALLQSVWVRFHQDQAVRGDFPVVFAFPRAWKRVMISECENPCVFPTRIGFLASDPRPPSGASSVIPRHASSRCVVSEKNALWHVWAVAAHLLRPQGSLRPRLVLWRHPRVPGGRGATHILP